MIGKDVSRLLRRKRALFDVNLNVRENTVTALIGPSGCGKSTFLRTLNRMNDTIDELPRRPARSRSTATTSTTRRSTSVELRARVGMVFQKPNPFPKSIYENVAYGPQHPRPGAVQGRARQVVESSLQKAGLWNEVKDRLHEPGTGLSGGQQQRLCIARAIAVSPEVILMDEPCSALDPIATAKIEELIDELRANFTIVIVTHYDAAGGARAPSARPSSTSAIWSRTTTTDQMFTNPERPSAPRTTSPAASADRTETSNANEDHGPCPNTSASSFDERPRRISTRLVARDGRPCRSSMVRRWRRRAG